MTLEVVKIEPKTKDPREIVVFLETLLEQAKAGEFEAVMALCVRAEDGAYRTYSSGWKDLLRLAGALSAAQFDLLKVGGE